MSRCGNDRHPGCGKDVIVWGVTPDGKRIPLDIRAPVYKLGTWDAQAQCYPVERVQGYKVTHFATCPLANNFSQKGKTS